MTGSIYEIDPVLRGWSRVCIGQKKTDFIAFHPPNMCLDYIHKSKIFNERVSEALRMSNSTKLEKIKGVIGILIFVDEVMSPGTADDAREMEKLRKFTNGLNGLKKTDYMAKRQKIEEELSQGVQG